MTRNNTQASLVQRHMRTVIIIFAIVIAINIAIVLRVFLGRKSATLNPLWDYVSANVQQAVILESRMLLGLLGDNLGTVSNNPLYHTLTQSNHIGLLQFGEGMINQHSAIVIDAKRGFSVTDFLTSINLQDDTDYTFHRYTDDIYVFGQPRTIDMMLDPSHQVLTDREDFGRIQPLIAGRNISFISRVDPDATSEQIVSDFVAQTDMFVLGIQGRRGGVSLDAHLLYTTPRTDILEQDFQAQMTDFIDEQTIAYIETSLANLRSDDEQGDVIASLRDYDPLVFGDLSDADISDILSDNIALLAQNSPTFSDLRLALLFNNPNIYSMIAPLFPLLQEPLAALAGLDPALVPLVEENQRIAYQTTLFGLADITLQSYVDDAQTVVSLGSNQPLTRSRIHRPIRTPGQSIGYIFVQFDPLLQLYRQLNALGEQNIQDPFLIQQELLLQGKTWAGYLSVDSEKVSLWSRIE